MIALSTMAGRDAVRAFSRQLTMGDPIDKDRWMCEQPIMSAPVTASHGRYAADPVHG
jgi:hypothetical protein